MYFKDDCVYRYYICTERIGIWPNNKERCVELFENCNKFIENRGDSTLSGTTPETTSRPNTTTQDEDGNLFH